MNSDRRVAQTVKNPRGPVRLARTISASGPLMPTRRKARHSSTTSAAWASSWPPWKNSSAKRGEHIKAIGIVGSDVYDTLLILQALRHRFPNVLFFTTGLDARFWHPRELSWSRNLIVTSSYGLSLHPELQKSVPLFRDSLQTAQYTAVLAALGHPELRTLTFIPPRRFEIGKRGAVDLSVHPAPG